MAKKAASKGGTTTKKTVKQDKVALCHPVVSYFHRVEALLAGAGVKVALDYKRHVVRVYVDCPCQAEALARLLKPEQVFGNFTVKVVVYPGNTRKAVAVSTEEITDPKKFFKTALKGNTWFKDVSVSADPFSRVFVIFKKKVVQYYDDNFGDPNGNISTIAENLAREVFQSPIVCTYSTANK